MLGSESEHDRDRESADLGIESESENADLKNESESADLGIEHLDSRPSLAW